MYRQRVDEAMTRAPYEAMESGHGVASIFYLDTVDGGASGMTDAALEAHVVEQVRHAIAQARASTHAIVAVTCIGPLGAHIHEDPRTAQVVARAICRVDPDIALIMAEANECARVAMDCGMQVAIATGHARRA